MPLNPEPTIAICSECPPPVVFPALAESCSGLPVTLGPCWLSGQKGPGGGQSPNLPPPIPPPAGGGGGGGGDTCTCCICWDICEDEIQYQTADPELVGEGEPGGGGSVDPVDPCPRSVIVIGPECFKPGTGGGVICNGMYQTFAVCSSFSAPCIDTDNDGECIWSDPDEDPNDIDDETLADWRDADEDGIPDGLDLEPNGPKYNEDGTENEDYKLNENGLIPPDVDMFEMLLGDLGAPGLDLDDHLPSNPALWDVNGDGLVTFGDAVGTIASQLADADGNNIPDAIDNYIDNLLPGAPVDLTELAAIWEHLSEAASLTGELYELMDPEAFGGEDLKEQVIANLNAFAGAAESVAAQFSVTDEGLAGIEEYANDNPADFFDDFDLPSGLSIEDIQEIILGFFPDGDGNLTFKMTVIDEDGVEHEIDPTPDTPKSNMSTEGDPIDTHSGEFYFRTTDLKVPGRGLDLEISRVYRSRSTRKGVLGWNWSMPLVETNIVIWPQWQWKMLDLIWGDGNRSYFVLTHDTANVQHYSGINGEFGKVRFVKGEAPDEPGCDKPLAGFVLRKPDGTLYYFCPPTHYAGNGGAMVCWLRKVVDSNGNAIVIQRDGMGRVTKIIDTVEREYLFTYDTDENLLTKIVDPEGRTIDYDYGLNAVPITGTPAPGSASGPIDPVLLPPFKAELNRVDYPTTQYLAANGIVASGRPSEVYTYMEHPDGFEQNKEPFVNHNLTSIRRSGFAPFVTLTYFTADEGAYEFDRVASQTIAGQTTTFDYHQIDNPQVDMFGQEIEHTTTFRFPDGELHKFHHAENGMLMRKEILEFRDADGDFIPDQTDPAGVNAYVTLLQYSEPDFLLLSRTETTDYGFPLGELRTRSWVYDDQNVDRFQQSNILQIIDTPQDPASELYPQITSSFLYDPVTVRPRQITDSVDRVTTRDFLHQELTQSEAGSLFGVSGWNIAMSDTVWSLGDINGDAVTGHTASLYGEPMCTLEVARETMPSILVEDPDGPGAPQPFVPIRKHRYNRFGQQTHDIDPNDVIVRTTYRDGFPRTRTYDSGGLALAENTFFDGIGRLIRKVATDGRATRLTYDGRDRLIELRREPLGAGDPTQDEVKLWFFDLAGRESGATSPFLDDATYDPYGSSSPAKLDESFTYDAANRVIQSVETIEFEGQVQTSTWSFSYDGNGRRKELIDPAGAVTRIQRNTRGLPTDTTRTDSAGTDYGTISVTYDNFGDRTVVYRAEDSDLDGIRDRTQFQIDGYGRTRAVIDDDGSSRTFQLDPAGRALVVEKKDAFGNVVQRTTNDFDDSDQLLRETHDEFQLNPDGTVVDLARTRVIESGYGPQLGLPLWVVEDPTGTPRLKRFRYDALGRRTEVIVGSSGEVRVVDDFDSSNRIVTRTFQHDALGTTGDVNPSETIQQYFYDSLGRLAEFHDPNDESTFFTHDASGRLTSTTDPSGTVRRTYHDSDGRVRRTETQRGSGPVQVSTFEYDHRGAVVAIEDGEAQRTEFDYDTAGRMTHRRTLATAENVEYRYDRSDRVEEIEFLHDVTGTIRFYDYDGDDRLVSINAIGADADVSRSYEFDALDRITRITESVTGRPTVTVELTSTSVGRFVRDQQQVGTDPVHAFDVVYDSAGDVREIHYPSGLTCYLDYDDLGRPVQARKSPTEVVADYTEPYGLRGYRRVDFGSGGRIERDFDPFGRVTRHDVLSGGGSTIHGASYEYDGSGNLEARVRSTDGRREEFDYDDFHRLEEWRVDTLAVGGATRTVHWDRDLADNTVSKSDTLGSNPVVP
ncbi:MAG: RHS repeat protein, partial [Planctomycetes bacterium]|nr:RHS repeat protein [Planctomycetota bacterium]